MMSQGEFTAMTGSAKALIRDRLYQVKMVQIASMVLLAIAILLSGSFMGIGSGQSAYAASSLRLKAASANGRHIALGLNKSMVIETPRDVKDVLVSSPEIADAVVRSARRVYLIGMKIGQANVVLFDSRGAQIASFDINVTRDNASLAALIRRMIPGSNVKIEGVGEGVVLTGTVYNASDSQKAADIAANYVGDKKKVSNYIAVQSGEQVQLRVTVAEVEHTLVKQLGINLSGQVTSKLINLSGVTDTPFSATNASLSNTALKAVFGRANGDNAAGTLKAMERSGLVRTLAEPNLTAISGEKANFLAGGEFPIPVGLDDGKISIEYKPFGVGLGFRPVVMSENRISLQVKTEVSEISTETSVRLGDAFAGLSIPGLKVRRSESTLELPSGGTMAMAGLLKDDVRMNIDGFPVLKDVPVLGQLFRSRDYQRKQTELVIFITPYIVRPMARSQAVDPGQNLELVGDMENLFLGALNRRYGLSGDKSRNGAKYHGRFGYSYK